MLGIQYFTSLLKNYTATLNSMTNVKIYSLQAQRRSQTYSDHYVIQCSKSICTVRYTKHTENANFYLS
jgi:hypothetical protein